MVDVLDVLGLITTVKPIAFIGCISDSIGPKVLQLSGKSSSL